MVGQKEAEGVKVGNQGVHAAGEGRAAVEREEEGIVEGLEGVEAEREGGNRDGNGGGKGDGERGGEERVKGISN